MKKPIDIAILRGPQFYAFSDCYLDTVERRLFKKNKRIEVTAKALEVLQVLVENAGQVVSKDELLGQIWGESFVEEGNLPVQISKLRSVLCATKDEPFIVTESGVGYRFVSPVRMVDDDEWSEIIENELSKREDGKHRYTSIAIMPLLNENGDEEVEYLAEGITESLINSLSRVPELRVIARNTVFQFKNKEIDLKKLGRRLRVATILTGRVRLVRDNLVIGVELTKVSDGTQIWGTQLNEPFDDIFEVQEKISGAIGANLKTQLKMQLAMVAGKRGNVNFESYRQFMMGNYLVRKSQVVELRKAVCCYQKSIGTDPTNVLSYVGLAYAQFLLYVSDEISLSEVRRVTQTNLDIAKSFDGSNHDVLVYTAVFKLYLEFDHAGATETLEAVLENYPDHLIALGYYARILAFTEQELPALRTIKRISEIDAFSISSNMDIGKILYFLGRYDLALERFREVIEVDRYHYRALLMSGATLAELQKYDDAIEALDSARNIQETVEIKTTTAYVYALMGVQESALDLVQEFESDEEFNIVPSHYVAAIYAALGDTTKAIEYLTSAFEMRCSDLAGIKVDPRWKTLRSDPRFNRIVSDIFTVKYSDD